MKSQFHFLPILGADGQFSHFSPRNRGARSKVHKIGLVEYKICFVNFFSMINLFENVFWTRSQKCQILEMVS